MGDIKYEIVDRDDVPAPIRGRRSKGSSKYDKLLRDFADSGYDAIVVNQDACGKRFTPAEAAAMANNLRAAIKRLGYDSISVQKRDDAVYLIDRS